MKIITASIKNFGSYKELDFKFNTQGLTLISGPTGAGKSTLMDIIPWILFGKTAKNGSVDEIRSWNAEESTAGSLYLESENGDIVVRRTRGKINDLSYSERHDVKDEIRGKDVSDTQKLLNRRLGFDYETFMASAYFHEFSATAQFFTAPAKVRRQITEQLVDLTLVKTLADKTSSYKKELNTEIQSLDKKVSILQSVADNLMNQLSTAVEKAEKWATAQTEKISRILHKQNNAERNKTAAIASLNAGVGVLQEQATGVKETMLKIETEITTLEGRIVRLSIRAYADNEVCTECGAHKANPQKKAIIKDIQNLEDVKRDLLGELVRLTSNSQQIQHKISSQNASLITIRQDTNDFQEQLDEARAEQNPHDIQDLEYQIDKASLSLEGAKKDLEDFRSEKRDLELLSETLLQFRGLLVINTVAELQNRTNELLSKHFDGEIRAIFEAKDSDSIEVSLYKDGNLASFTQLSKGQRQILKLCFGVSVMRTIQERNANTINLLMLDEPTDGCDENLKVNSYGLLQELSTHYDSVFVIDHNEAFKSMFVSRCDVELIDGVSRIA